MMIKEAHCKFSHIAHAAIKHAMTAGKITGVEIDQNSKPEFCEACAKTKVDRVPFPKQLHTSVDGYVWGQSPEFVRH
jgi:hypothetical protein